METWNWYHFTHRRIENEFYCTRADYVKTQLFILDMEKIVVFTNSRILFILNEELRQNEGNT